MAIDRMTEKEYRQFIDYFDCADETYESLTASGQHRRNAAPGRTFLDPLTLDDLDKRCVTRARKAADRFDLPWPPYLPAAEDFALENARVLREHQSGEGR